VPNTVVAEAAVDMGPEWRTFNKEKRVKTAPLRLVVKTDMVVKAEHGARWRRLAKFHRETLHGYERRLAKGGELKRIKECVGLPQHVMEEAGALLKYFDVGGASRLKSPRRLCCRQRLRRLARLGLWKTS
jgi:transcription initiation factor TFIIIB Brf1 subunit/transcription initiation factor TFIIB